MTRPSQAVAWMLLLLPLAWIALLVGLFSIFSLRQGYLALWHEHQDMLNLIARGQDDVRSPSGDTLVDTFEYLTMAQDAYLRALQDFIILGLFPAMMCWFGVGWAAIRMTYTSGQASRAPDKPRESKQPNTI
jgi:hypothetical protein